METVHNWIMDETIETLIEEVEKWPALYNKTLKEYANINILTVARLETEKEQNLPPLVYVEPAQIPIEGIFLARS